MAKQLFDQLFDLEDDIVKLSETAHKSVIISRLEDLYEKTYQLYLQKTQSLERAEKRAETHSASFSLVRRIKRLKTSIEILEDLLRDYAPTGRSYKTFLKWNETGRDNTSDFY